MLGDTDRFGKSQKTGEKFKLLYWLLYDLTKSVVLGRERKDRSDT